MPPGDAAGDDEARPPAGRGLTRRGLLGRAAKLGVVGALAAAGGLLASARSPDPAGDRAVVLAPPPSGEDDSAMLAALCVGNREVRLRAGATYVLGVPDAISGTGFTGRIVGNGATLRFGYTGRFSDQLSAINKLDGVTFDDLLITAPSSTLFSVFRDCSDLRLENVTIYACAPKLTYAMPRGFTGRNLRWITVGAPPEAMDGSLYVPDAGDFSLVDFEYDSVFTGETGAIVSAVATVPRAGATVYVARGRCFVRDLPGHSVDGAIDLEPAGEVPFEKVTIEDLELANTTCYLTGADEIDVRNVRIRYTANNVSGRAVPFVVYNNNRVQPPLGELRIRNCEVEWSSGNPARQASGILSFVGHPGATVTFSNNRYRLGFSPVQVIESLYWIKDGATPTALTIDGDVVEDTSAAWESPRSLVEMGSAVQRLVVRNSTVEGTFANRLTVRPDESGTNELIAMEGNDFSGATFRNGDLVTDSVTISEQP